MQKFGSFELILSISKSVVSHQCFYLLLSSESTLVHFFYKETILFSLASANKRHRGYFVIIICFQGLSSTTLLASKYDHRTSRSIRFVIARSKSQSNCYFKFLPSISLFCRLFHFFVRFFTLLPVILMKTERQLTNQIPETTHSMYLWRGNILPAGARSQEHFKSPVFHAGLHLKHPKCCQISCKFAIFW